VPLSGADGRAVDLDVGADPELIAADCRCFRRKRTRACARHRCCEFHKAVPRFRRKEDLAGCVGVIGFREVCLAVKARKTGADDLF